jgi:transposase-like protein
MITYTEEQLKLIKEKQKEAKTQYNTSFTAKRRAQEERAEAKRELLEMGIGI